MLACATLSMSAVCKTFLVTGATDGIGLATCDQLVRAGNTVLVHGRSPDKVQRVVAELNSLRADAAVGYVADLSSMAAVRRLGAEVAAANPALDGLLNNAGSFDGDYTGERVVTEDGNEYTLAVNVLAPFLLTSLLLPALRASGAGRVVISSSVSQAIVTRQNPDLNALRRTPKPWGPIASHRQNYVGPLPVDCLRGTMNRTIP